METPLCIDARHRGSHSRFVRRSCRPNTQLKHVLINGQLHVLLVAIKQIELGTEITAPQDSDFRYVLPLYMLFIIICTL
jgi:SET domain-containing protein